MEKKNKNKIEKEDVKEENLVDLLKETLEISKKNQSDLRYIRRFILWLQVWGAIKIVIILIPIILGIIYLPPFIKEWMGTLLGPDVAENHQKEVILDVFAK